MTLEDYLPVIAAAPTLQTKQFHRLMKTLLHVNMYIHLCMFNYVRNIYCTLSFISFTYLNTMRN